MADEFDARKRLAAEDRLPLRKAKSLFEGSPSLRTLRRYIQDGLYCPVLADRVRLEAYRSIGMSWITSKQAIERFYARIDGKDV
jgi:hypothetical protein